MSHQNKIGLGNSLSRKTQIFHGGVSGCETFGRLVDQVTVWLRSKHQLSRASAGDYRVLLQALLEFAFPENTGFSGHIEVAEENGLIFTAVRFKNHIFEEGEAPEKALTHHWLNAVEATLIKRILLPQDVVEIRCATMLRLVELRIVRPLGDNPVLQGFDSFKVIIDGSVEVKTDHQEYLEMGDYGPDDWKALIYSENGEQSKAGEMYLNGDSLQSEDELAKLIVNQELIDIDENSKKLSRQNDDLFNQEKVLLKAGDDGLRALIVKNKLLENLVRKKELKIRKQMNSSPEKEQDIAIIRSNSKNKGDSSDSTVDLKVNGGSVSTDHSKAFREKALQMFEMAKRLQAEKEKLLLQIKELRKGSDENDIGLNSELSQGANSSQGTQLDDLLKKADRLSRALEAEKQKVKVLSDRVTVAEKEAQSAAPIINDLEQRVDVSLKNAQQYKKETESVKQKLVQAEAEKNKIKNELVKAEAQIQTLMKRHAS